MDPLLTRIERYLRRSGMRPTPFGREAARDPHFVRDMRKGREPRSTLRRRVNDWLDGAEQALEATDKRGGRTCRPR
ncbi:MAG TPA: hypothetical protein VGB62_05545 [Allosphingosinicella sp.]